jgi:hypothetical protein
LVTFIKDTTSYGIYIIQSEAGTNDDWMTDHAGNPIEADIELFTLGTEYVYLELKNKIQKTNRFYVQRFVFPSGKTYYYMDGKEDATLTFGGLETTRANAEKLEQFGKTHNRPTAKTIYLFVWEAAGTAGLWTFYDHTPTARYYMRGHLVQVRWDWSEDRNAVHNLQLTFLADWRAT